MRGRWFHHATAAGLLGAAAITAASIATPYLWWHGPAGTTYTILLLANTATGLLLGTGAEAWTRAALRRRR